MAFQSADPTISARELEAQSVIFTCDLVAGTSNLAADVAIANGTISAAVISLDVHEVIQKVLCVRVSNRATGAVIATTAAPVVTRVARTSLLAESDVISVTVNGTAQSDVCVEVIYILA